VPNHHTDELEEKVRKPIKRNKGELRVEKRGEKEDHQRSAKN